MAELKTKLNDASVEDFLAAYPEETLKDEEALLADELKGYREYMRKTRYRLFPGIW